MQRLTYVVYMSLSHNHGKRPPVVLVNPRMISRACTSLVPKPMTVVVGLGTRLDVCTRTINHSIRQKCPRRSRTLPPDLSSLADLRSSLFNKVLAASRLSCCSKRREIALLPVSTSQLLWTLPHVGYYVYEETVPTTEVLTRPPMYTCVCVVCTLVHPEKGQGKACMFFCSLSRAPGAP